MSGPNPQPGLPPSPPVPGRESPKPKAHGVVVPHRANWKQRTGARAVYLLLHAVAGTVRCRLEDEAGLLSRPRDGAVIFCFWHNRLAMCMEVYLRFARKVTKNSGIAALVSASRDGGFLSRVLELFNVQPVRGSTSRRGPQALREMVTWAERGYDLAITPDGPRGPCYQVADGVTSLAQLTGLPVVPLAFNLSWKISVRSWDRFQIPVPFAKCTVKVAKPILVPREATDQHREQLRQQLERTLKEISKD